MILGGSRIVVVVKGRKIPSVAKEIARLTESMKDATAANRGCCRPKPPLLSEVVEMMCACAGMESTLSSSWRKELSKVENSVQRVLDQRFHWLGSSEVGVIFVCDILDFGSGK